MLNRNTSWRSMGPLIIAFAVVVLACSGDEGSSIEEVRSVTVLPDREGPVFVANVAFTDDGFDPPTVFIPAGQPVRLVIRNRTDGEHHYRVVGLIATDVRWMVYPVLDLATIESEELTVDEIIALDPSMAALTDTSEIDHVLHHMAPYASAIKEPSASGIRPIPGEVHGYAERGGFDTLIFIPIATGRFEVEDVLNPSASGSVVVFLSESANLAGQ